ncbi:PQQ-binding-like beta-propeller repeat protein [Methanococcoides seepicolus]|uniref:PQQ-like beta-propeller repeat protein n=1 Tax=Methanococcoides seepicolus TaxID=2828780 RepID=A0A9E5DC56_9EURY|nr:PQQ-binding-like beta-propeller repeat protein [Methanococcoides seepicolus]MCM1987058.1 PQQ-like beta-propeller repeat protein [Methanococcoides seepicolus]
MTASTAVAENPEMYLVIEDGAGDGSGDSDSEIVNVYMGNTAEDLYIDIEMENGPYTSAYMNLKPEFDLDMNSSTGKTDWSYTFGADYWGSFAFMNGFMRLIEGPIDDGYIEIPYKTEGSTYKVIIPFSELENKKCFGFKVDCSSPTGGDYTQIITYRDPTSWNQFLNSPQHTGSSLRSAPDTNNILWSAKPLDANQSIISGSSTAVAEGKVFANCVGEIDMYGNPLGETGALVAFDKDTGEEIWNATIDVAEWGSWSSPAYDDGKVFTSTGQDTTCIDAATGNILWNFTTPTGSASCNGGPAIAEGKVICSDWDGNHYYCLDENTGNELWNYTVSGNAQSTPAIFDGKIVLTGWNEVYCLDMDGNLLWNITNPSTTGNLCGSPSISDSSHPTTRLTNYTLGDYDSYGYSMVYLTTYDFYGDSNPALFALNLTDGSQIWNATIQRTDNAPTIAYGNLYVSGGCSGFSESQTYCFNATSGELIWSTTKEMNGIGDWTCSPTVADGKVFIGKPSGSYMGQNGLVALDAFTGEMVWESPNAGATAAIADGVVYSIGGPATDVTLYAFGEVAGDWNPWNNADSDGLPDGTYITLTEVIDAYNCFRNGTPAPETGASIDLTKVIDLYNAFRNGTPM